MFLSEEALVSLSRGDKGPHVVAHDVLLSQHGGAGGALGDQGHPPPTQNANPSQRTHRSHTVDRLHLRESICLGGELLSTSTTTGSQDRLDPPNSPA